MVLPEWAIERETEASLLLRSAKRREHLASVHRLVTKAEVERTVPGVNAGFGDHVDESEAGVVVFSGVWIKAKADLADLRFRWQFSAAKAVDANLRTGTRELIDRVFKLLRIVGELGNLVRRQNVGERGAVGIGRPHLGIFRNIDVHFDHIDLE